MNEQTGETRLAAAAAVVVVVVAVNVEYQKRGKRWTRMIGKKKKQSSGVMAAAAKRGMVPPRSGKWPVAESSSANCGSGHFFLPSSSSTVMPIRRSHCIG